MFQWFTEWRKKRLERRQAQERAERIEEHALFSYWDGEAVRYADPFDILRKLLAWQSDVGEEVLADAQAAKEPAATEVVAQLCTIFDVHPWDETAGTGLTGWEILRLARQFEKLIDDVKKNGSPGPTSPPPTDSTPSTGPAVLAEAAKDLSGSTSTPAESIPDAAG